MKSDRRMRVLLWIVAAAAFLEAGLIVAGVLEPDWVSNAGVRVVLGVFMVAFGWASGRRR